jgi:ribose/xylose/arabinose/galactoside ABC-type transport system permease subunit
VSEPRDEARSGEPAGAGGPAGQPSTPQSYPLPGRLFRRLLATSPAPQDSLAVHLVWEGILLVIAAVLVFAALATVPGATFAGIVQPIGAAGLIASGLALSLRTGTPNLAVGSIAIAAGAFSAHFAADGWSLWPAMTLAVVLAAVAGLITGLVTAALSVPAWAITLGAAILIQSAAFGISPNPVQFKNPGTFQYPSVQWLMVFVVVSVGGGGLWLFPSVRLRLSRARNAGEPGRWVPLSAGTGTVAGLTGSSLLAGAGGVAITIYQGSFPGGVNLASEADPLTIAALAAVLVGGVSVFGRRAGLLGTVFGVVIVETVQFMIDTNIPRNSESFAWLEVPVAALVVVGLGVSRALESISNAMNRQLVPGRGKSQ